MTERKITYPAKLLLFGEHTVLKGSSSLAIPFTKYGMSWKKGEKEHPAWLKDYVTYLKKYCYSFLDIHTLEVHMDTFTIVADIPIGYGLGSSGALTAAIYDICKKTNREVNLSQLQVQLGLMESFFHGQSSGFDPLVSHCNRPIRRFGKEIEIIEKSQVGLPMNCYLLDSGTPRSGKNMIELFLSNWESKGQEMDALCKANNQAVNIVLGRSTADLDKTVRIISSIQLESMTYMIVPKLVDLWHMGLKSKEYSLKICGAGGGGYYLVFSKKPLKNIGPYKIEKVTSQ